MNKLIARAEDCFEAAAKATNCSVTLTKDVVYKDVVHNVAPFESLQEARPES
ncbi:hypothetical protein MTO96_050219, partial [Rhipicephalus appendiculatus]